MYIPPMPDDNSYIEFAVNENARFEKLQTVFNALKLAKETDEWHDEPFWQALFDKESLATFWWPTEEEVKDWGRRWVSTPLPQRWEDPSLKHPWHFASLIDAFRNGEYDLLACQIVSPGIAQLQFLPLAYPYGGTGCMEQLITSFGHRVTKQHGT